MRRALFLLLIFACLGGLRADCQDDRPVYSVTQGEDGSCKLWLDEKQVWSSATPTRWEESLVAQDGKLVVGVTTREVFVLGSQGKLLHHLRLPQGIGFDRDNLGWVTARHVYLRDRKLRLYRLLLGSGQFGLVSKSDLESALASAQAPAESAAWLAAAAGVKIPASKLASLPKDSASLAVYEARWGRPGPLQALLKKGDEEMQDWAVLVPGVLLETVLRSRDHDYPLLARLCNPAQIEQARALMGKPGPCQVKATYLLCQSGDDEGQQRVLRRCLTKTKESWSEERAQDILVLTESDSPLCAQLVPSLSQAHNLELDYLLNYFLDHPGPKVLPMLAKHVTHPDLGVDCQQVLQQQTRVNWGADAAAWEKWLSGPPPVDPRGRANQLGAEPSAPQWLGRIGTVQETRQLLAATPRTVAVLASGPTDRLTFTSDQGLVRLQGTTTQRAYEWDLRGKVRQEFPPSVPSGLDFQFSKNRSVCVLLNSETHEVALLGKGPLKWHPTDLARQVFVSPMGDCFVVGQQGYDNFEVVPIVGGRADWERKISIRNYDDPPFFGPAVVPVQFIAADLDGKKLFTSPFDQPPLDLGGDNIWPDGFYPDGQKILKFQDSYGLLEIKSRRFEPIPCLRPLDLSLRFNRFSPSGKYLGLQTVEDVHIVNLPGDRVQVLAGLDVSQMEFSPDDHQLVLATKQWIRLYALPKVKLVAELRSLPEVTALAFSADSRYFAAVVGQQIRLFEVSPTVSLAADADVSLLTELWMGQRLAGGAATPLTPEQYNQRLHRWAQSTGDIWGFERPAPSMPGWLLRLTALAVLAAAGLTWWSVSRRKMKLTQNSTG